MKSTIKALLPKWLKERLKVYTLNYFDWYAIKSYSQEGEDMILWRIFGNVEHGFYVDVGAHHPIKFSNTYFFYKKGWHGINIDAQPGSMKLFNQIRPRDINIEAAVSKERKELTFYMFNEPALNTLDAALARERISDKYYVIEERKIITKTLSEILNENLPINTKINFMSVDVEGYDLEVIQSNDWKVYRPEYILIESYSSDINEIQRSELYNYLTTQNYTFFGKTVLTIIFKDKLGLRQTNE